MSFLGVDIGTSGCKAAVFAASGELLGEARRSYAVSSPRPGWAELDAALALELSLEAIAEAVAKAKEPVQALSVSSQGEAFAPVGPDGLPLANAMVSSDSRAAGEVAPFVEAFGLERLYAITGHTPSPLFSLFKMLWLKRERPDVWRRSSKLLCFEDLLLARLGVEPAMGWPLAGRTMLFDVKKHRWSAEILAALELDEGKLARPLRSGGVAGELSPEMARRLGLPKGVLAVAGGHDQTIAALGAGVFGSGDAMYAAGSVECICPVFDRPVFSPALMRGNLCCYDYSLEGRHCSVAYSLTGSNLLQYLLEQFGGQEAERAAKEGGNPYELFLRGMPAAPSSLLALPYFTPSGTPFFDIETPGALLGLRLSTSRGEIVKALLEAVALEMKLNLSLLEGSGVRVGRLFATGGGVRSASLLQLKADVLGKPIAKLRVGELGCLGAARLAASAVLGAKPDALLPGAEGEPSLARPDPLRASAYEEKFEQYKLLYPELKRISRELLARKAS